MTPDPAFQAEYEARAITQAGGALTFAALVLAEVRGTKIEWARDAIASALDHLSIAVKERLEKERAA